MLQFIFKYIMNFLIKNLLSTYTAIQLDLITKLFEQDLFDNFIKILDF